MLLSVVLTLKPAEACEAPAVLGRAAHAWFLARLRQVDASLAERLHSGDESRPFTVSNLWGMGPVRDGRVALRPERPCWLRVTTLNDETSAALERALPAPGWRLLLGESPFIVQSSTFDAAQHPWAGSARYVNLLQRNTLGGGPPPRAALLEFATPTLFRQQGRDLPLPLPALVFGGYLHKWNAFSPIRLPEEALRYATECVALGRYELRSQLVSFEGAEKGAHVGFVGQVRFRFLEEHVYWTRIMRLLADYAFWCGTGYRTSVGLGQTRMLQEHRGDPSSFGLA